MAMTAECGYRLVVDDIEAERFASDADYDRWLGSKGMLIPDGCPICSAGEDRFRWEHDNARGETTLFCSPEAHREFYDALERIGRLHGIRT